MKQSREHNGNVLQFTIFFKYFKNQYYQQSIRMCIQSRQKFRVPINQPAEPREDSCL